MTFMAIITGCIWTYDANADGDIGLTLQTPLFKNMI